ncbi:protein SHORT HYPOCOTYL IN WHITE LIGHT 1 [Cynara cardunculus var. scolymus]|nr:protein SHORT HYPOCOTYL IN WHITE LIGHT 1 [Cynara cardunculus var. scolymus]
MAASSATISPSSSPQSLSIFRPQQLQSPSLSSITFVRPFQLRTPGFRLQASRRSPNFSQEGENPVVDPRNWSRNRNDMTFSGDYDEDDDEEDEEEEEDDRSLDLLIRFVENVFKKISRRARKAVRSVLPTNIPTKLVGFSVNGVIILAFFWILKAFLEVVCTLGSVVFVSILLVRGVWTGISYFQEGRYRRTDDFDDENQAWTGTRPAA